MKQSQLPRSWTPVIEHLPEQPGDSKYSGIPLLQINEEWPICSHCEKPMQLFLQLNLEKIPRRVQKVIGYQEGYLQLFYCNNFETDCEGFCHSANPFTPGKMVRVISSKMILKPGSIDYQQYEQDHAFPYFHPRVISRWNREGALDDDQLQIRIPHQTTRCIKCSRPMRSIFQFKSEKHLPYSFFGRVAQITQCPIHRDTFDFNWHIEPQ